MLIDTDTVLPVAPRRMRGCMRNDKISGYVRVGCGHGPVVDPPRGLLLASDATWSSGMSNSSQNTASRACAAVHFIRCQPKGAAIDAACARAAASLERVPTAITVVRDTNQRSI